MQLFSVDFTYTKDVPDVGGTCAAWILICCIIGLLDVTLCVVCAFVESPATTVTVYMIPSASPLNLSDHRYAAG